MQLHSKQRQKNRHKVPFCYTSASDKFLPTSQDVQQPDPASYCIPTTPKKLLEMLLSSSYCIELKDQAEATTSSIVSQSKMPSTSA